MKTPKAINKQGKISEDKDAVKSKKVIFSKSGLSEEDIREKAEEIYNQRIDRGEHGNAADDWFEAEKFLRDSVD